MKKEVEPIVENRFEYEGFPCVVIFQPGCFRCGYVGLPQGNKYYGKEYNEIENIECHCGLTYSRDYLFGQKDEDIWWIGFDCAHYRDGYDYETGEKYWGDDLYIEALKRVFGNEYSAKTLGYVEGECQHIVDQIIKENKMEEEEINITKEQKEETKQWLNNLKDRRKTTKAILLSNKKGRAKYRCENCKYILSNKWFYCPVCGRKIDWENKKGEE